VQILAMMRHGRLRPLLPGTTITEATILILAGTAEGLEAYDAQFQDPTAREAPVLILGGGRVGRSAAEAFARASVPCTIVEQVPGRAPSSMSVVEGDAADLEVLQAAGLQDASAALVTTHDDDLNIYLT